MNCRRALARHGANLLRNDRRGSFRCKEAIRGGPGRVSVRTKNVPAGMKSLLALGIAVCSLGCTAINRPSCRLPCGVSPAEPAHRKPYGPQPWQSTDAAFPYSVWAPKNARPVKAVVILAPGWDGTMRDYAALAEHLAAHGYVVYGSEQRSGVYDPKKGRRGNPRAWHEWVRDLQGFTAFVRRKHPGLPLFYHGHSFGTLVATQTASEATQKPAGLILQSMAMPLLIEKESAAKGALIGAFAWLRVPHLRLAGEVAKPTGDEVLNCQWLHSRDRVAEGYKVRYFLQAAKLGHQARLSSRALHLPVLALEGEQDSVVAPKPGDKQAYDQYLRHELRGGRAEVIAYRHGYHTMTIPPTGHPALDQTASKALRDITAWLDRQTR